MKKKIGEIYNKPVVIGNKNEVTKNEVHIDELSSGSGSGDGSGSSWKYYDYTECSYDQRINIFSPCGMMIKMITEDDVVVFGAAGQQVFSGDIVAFAIDMSQSLIQGGKKMAVSEYLAMVEQRYGKLLEITEEEFYNLEA